MKCPLLCPHRPSALDVSLFCKTFSVAAQLLSCLTPDCPVSFWTGAAKINSNLKRRHLLSYTHSTLLDQMGLSCSPFSSLLAARPFTIACPLPWPPVPFYPTFIRYKHSAVTRNCHRRQSAVWLSCTHLPA